MTKLEKIEPFVPSSEGVNDGKADSGSGMTIHPTQAETEAASGPTLIMPIEKNLPPGVSGIRDNAADNYE